MDPGPQSADASVTVTFDLSEQLRCPSCTDRLVPGASLSCLRCGLSWPIEGGIPRFADQEHLASFGLQWNRYEVAHDEEDQATFQAKTGVNLSELSGLRVLDAGCGGGRYCRVAGDAGASVVGVDHTTAVEKAAQLCAHLPNVRFAQADLKLLPLKPASFDFVFSIGVMHHDRNTQTVFDAVAKMVKPAGRMSVWVYRRNQWWQELINSALRKRTTKMPTQRLERCSRVGARLGGIPLLNRTLNKIINFSAHPDWHNRVCDTFDWYAPEYQYHHTVSELVGWFREAGFDKLRVLPPEKTGRVYQWAYNRNLLIGSGVNVSGLRSSSGRL